MNENAVQIECRWCAEPAIATVHAQWTIFDFDDQVACQEHVRHAQAMFSRRWVDGSPPVGVWVTYWETDDSASQLLDIT